MTEEVEMLKIKNERLNKEILKLKKKLNGIYKRLKKPIPVTIVSAKVSDKHGGF